MVLVTGTAGMWELAKAVTTAWLTVILIMTGTAVTVLPQARRFIIRRAWCVLSRHRIQKVCFETRMHTRSGRLPLVLRIHPTQVGERALIWCRAGICAADFEAHTPEIAAACYARQARVEGNKRWAQLRPARHRAPRHPRRAHRHPSWRRPPVSEMEEGVMTTR